MAGVSEEYRRRVAVLLCLVGLGLVGTGVVMVLTNEPDAAPAPARNKISTPEQNRELGKTIQAVLFWALVLTGVFIISSLAFLRWSRRFRRILLHTPLKPTPVDDVWSMHRLPETDDPGWTTESEAPENDE